MQFAIGLDISFRSPGMCVYDMTKNRWHLFAFAKLLREIGFVWARDNVRVELFSPIPDADVHGYLHVETHLFEALNRLIPTKEARRKTKVAIEAYAYVNDKRGSEYKLHEIGGICKRQLEVSGFHDVRSVVAGAWKSHVMGHGVATKLDIVHHLAMNGPKIDLLAMFGYDETKLTPDERGRPIVPTPVQDLADSTCLAMYLFVPKCVKPKPPKRKREKKLPKAPPVLPTGFISTTICADVFCNYDDDTLLATHIHI